MCLVIHVLKNSGNLSWLGMEQILTQIKSVYKVTESRMWHMMECWTHTREHEFAKSFEEDISCDPHTTVIKEHNLLESNLTRIGLMNCPSRTNYLKVWRQVPSCATILRLHITHFFPQLHACFKAGKVHLNWQEVLTIDNFYLGMYYRTWPCQKSPLPDNPSDLCICLFFFKSKLIVKSHKSIS